MKCQHVTDRLTGTNQSPTPNYVIDTEWNKARRQSVIDSKHMQTHANTCKHQETCDPLLAITNLEILTDRCGCERASPIVHSEGFVVLKALPPNQSGVQKLSMTARRTSSNTVTLTTINYHNDEFEKVNDTGEFNHNQWQQVQWTTINDNKFRNIQSSFQR